MKPDRSDGLLTVQALRAVAALMVVVYHAIDVWGVHRVGKDADSIWGNGAAGVDLFFVISGLVMTLSAQRRSGLPHPARLFLRQRATRIFPLYWLVTTAKIVLVAMLPTLVSRTNLDPVYVLGSYFLLPVHDLTGQIRPVLPVGWTLIYEALFYIVVACALATRTSRPMRGAAVALVLLAIAGGNQRDFSSVLLLEFLLGIGVGHLYQVRTKIPLSVAFASILIGFAALLTAPLPTADLRPFVWGIPAALIVGGAVCAERGVHTKLPRWLLISGDASYALYLTHGFVIPAVWIVVDRTINNSIIAAVISILVSIVASLSLSWVVHLWIERPILRWSRRPATLNVAPAG